MTEDDDDAVTIEVTISAPVEAVWQSLRDPAWIRRWHGWHFDGLDQEVDQIYVSTATEGSEPYELDVEGGDRFVLTERAGETQVRITRAAPGSDPEWDAYYDDITEGWTSFLQQLRFAHEQQPGRERRTLFFSADRGGHPFEFVGVGDPVTSGARYVVADATSPVDSGAVWFVSAHQVGLTLDDLGPGLVVLGARPVGPASPDSGAMAILTTYGLDDAAFSAVRDRWSRWWRTSYPGGAEPVE